MDEQLSRYPRSRVVLEVGTHSPWVSRCVTKHGHEGIVANPRRVRLIAENDSKTDAVDAELLARLGRIDPGLLKPIVHRGERAQHDRILLLARDGLVRARTQLVNQVRGFAKSLGVRLPASSTEAFPKRVRATVAGDLFPGLGTMLETIQGLTDEIQKMNRSRGVVVSGVLSRDEGASPGEGRGADHRTGLCADLGRSRALPEKPLGRGLSGASTPATGVRRATPTASDHEGRRRDAAPAAGHVGSLHSSGPSVPTPSCAASGLRLAEHGGKAAKKRAVVAVARRLAVLLHRLWVTGEIYQPLGYDAAMAKAA